MKFFWFTVFSTYFIIVGNFHTFSVTEWRSLALPRYDFSILEINDTLSNKFLLFMLGKYKYISAKKRERNYFYYAKKACKLMMFLAIPWFMLVYFMEWYSIEDFYKWQFAFSSIIGLMPTFILNLMMTTYDVKLYRINRKYKKYTNVNSIDPVKSDIKKFVRKIISQQKETLTFLKQHGLRTTKHKHNCYSIAATDVKRVEEAVLKEFPKLYVVFSETPKGTRLLKVYNKQYDFLLMQMEISDK